MHEHEPAASDYFRTVRAALVPALDASEFVLAVWEGGAAANGRLDEHSDIDLCIAVADDSLEHFWSLFELSLESVGPISGRWTVDTPMIAGMHQRVYTVENSPPCFFVDCCVFLGTSTPPVFVRERHGTPLVHLDRVGFTREAALDHDAHRLRVGSAIRDARIRFEIYRRCVLKSIARGHELDAHTFYQRCLGLMCLVLGVTHRRERFDFGGRYLHLDLPGREQEQLSRLTYVGDVGQLTPSLDQLETWFIEVHKPLALEFQS